MKLQTQVPLKKVGNPINYNSRLLLLGSCFAESIGEKFNFYKFQSEQNPFGILFHPKAIEKFLSKVLRKETYSAFDTFLLNERWHCFDAHSDLSDVSQDNLLDSLNRNLLFTAQNIENSTHIIITLGTAWVYRHIETDAIVANCHKVPQKKFNKELLSVAEIVASLKNIVELISAVNEHVHFVFTLSPVRHLKDGFTENQRSKAHLVAAIHDLVSLEARCSYFPSYEIMMDELRDYRFYQTDMVHPNELAVDYIWEKFKQTWILEKEYPIMDDVASVQKGLAHRPFNSNSEQHQTFLKSLQKKITYLQQEYAFMKF